MLAPPTFQDVLSARQVISRHLPRTPLWSYGALSSLLGCDAAVKHENHQPVGAFKVRGGINLVSRLSTEERGAGVISASTGNHGQSVAYAARLFGVRATIVVPEGANPGKVESMRQLGAEVIFHGRDFDEAKVSLRGTGAAGRLPLRAQRQRAPPHRRRRHHRPGDPGGPAGDRGDHCAGGRGQRRRRRLHRGQGGEPGHSGHRRPVGSVTGRLPVVAVAEPGAGAQPDGGRRAWPPARPSSCPSASSGISWTTLCW